MLNLVANGSSGYNLNNSLRFRSSASAYLSRTPASNGNRQIWTWSGWVKRGSLAAVRQGVFVAQVSGGVYWGLEFDASNALNIYDSNAGGSTALTTTQVFRDPSAWYHIVIGIDTTQATATNRVKLYINGTQVTAFSVANYPTQNSNTQVNTGSLVHDIGNWNPSVSNLPFDGYITEVNFIDGQALTPSSFGSTNATTGVWQPAKYTGTYGTNGFYLNFSSIALTSGSNTGLGKDNSGNGNYWNTNNISVTAGTTYDAMTDVPTNTSATVANYCVLNPLNGAGSITNANLTHAGSGANWYSTASTIAFDASSNFYAEVTIVSNNAVSNGIQLGIIGAAQALSGNTSTLGSYATGYSWQSYVSGGASNKFNNGTGGNYNSLATYTTNDVIGIQLNAGTLTFYKNNVSQGSAYTGLSGSFCFGGSPYNGDTVSWNFGQRPFAYTPPTGYVALNTYNLPTPTILQGNKYMDATTFTGITGAQSIVNAGAFKPDLVWLKSRSNIQDNYLIDSVRDGTKLLRSNTIAADSTSTSPAFITSFNSNGFSSNSASLVSSGYTYVGWQWQAGQGSTSNITVNQYGSTPSIASTVSANTTAGFSVITYTGTGANATVGHGLGVAPSMIIIKSRSTTSDWAVYHASLGNTKGMFLDLADAAYTSSAYWNNTSPTSTVISLGTGADQNGSGRSLVAYCWAEIAGFSKFGSYTGNGSADGPFIYLGFRPKFLLIKISSAVGDWRIYDTSRSTFNAANTVVFPNLSDAEASSSLIDIDILSNGFKLRNNLSTLNANGATYIYAAYAENPFKNSLAR